MEPELKSLQQATREAHASQTVAPQPAPAGAPPGDAAAHEQRAVARSPIIAVHGVGDFNHGDLIGQIASEQVISRGQDYRRQTVFSGRHRFTLLEEDAKGNGNGALPRFFEINWSDVRRPLASVLGLAHNFVTVLMALMRIGAHGVHGSASLGAALRFPALTLWVFEGAMVWAALLPMLSALLWKLDPGQRFAAGLFIAGAAFYAAWRLRRISPYMCGGGIGFGLIAAIGGWITCTRVKFEFVKRDSGEWECIYLEQAGRDAFTHFVGAAHSWSVMLAGITLTLAALEILFFLRRGAQSERATWLQRFSRIGCLWLPVILLVIVQPITVSSVLLTMGEVVNASRNLTQADVWGEAYQAWMPFLPRTGQLAGGLAALSLLAALILGGLQFKLIQLVGRNGSIAACAAMAGGLFLFAWMSEKSGDKICQDCARPDLLGVLALLLVGAAIVVWQLYRERRTFMDADGRVWNPSGEFARFWIAALLFAYPVVLLLTIIMLFGGMGDAPSDFMPYAKDDRIKNAADVFLQSTKFAFLLLPLATKPFAALLDALGDVFYFVVKDKRDAFMRRKRQADGGKGGEGDDEVDDGSVLSTRMQTVPRVGRALRNLQDFPSGKHVVIFSHSQGTAIAARALDILAKDLSDGEQRITLVTVGSPITSLYRVFLGLEIGREYATLCKQQPQRFRWVNICRPADYIGSAVRLPDLSSIENFALLTAGDHSGYWVDGVVLSWIKCCTEQGAACAQGAPTWPAMQRED